ncbi:DEAD/DEAH box helicase [Pelagicoccus sp. SDUM812005]|uniref:DEAD/DEAH box helicase n=1 Tax=Pelagicoccus sp. SDUM812005 TaxID=3041257 RepID=UPI00280FBDA7|nr:DEAD/DEAH box helicase [Pelagicoccus sp. SDUM812005]MDQ8179248.1 DEAD/DEAH box helicase [Pelagicoccus sp. SDUM812005]
MDPFVFDQRFAKFVGQVDSAALAKGTELYEAGAARVDALGGSSIRGAVIEKREGAFQVSLAVNDAGGLSGSCSCAEFFNCAHAYALARVARDRLVGKVSSPTRNSPPKVEPLSPLQAELERVWKLAKQSGYLLYPKDLYKLVSNRAGLGVAGREPIRDLKRVLQQEAPKSVEDFSGLLFDYFEYKGIQGVDGFERPVRSRGSKGGFAPAPSEAKWDRPALKLRVRIGLEESPDRDWFQARAQWEVEGGGFSAEEIRKLRDAEGALVKLDGKGWCRLDRELDEKDARALSSLGLDPDRGNSQRIHLCQVEDLLAEEMLGKARWKELRSRAKALSGREAPRVPKVLEGVLRPYQIEGFSYLCRLSQLELGGILADDMGLGKTVQTIAWLLWLAERSKPRFRVLVVCPKSVTDNWVQEPIKFKTGLSTELFRSVEQGIGESSIVVANYAQLRIHGELFTGQDWDAVVLDEAQYIKSPTSQTSKVAYKLRGRHRLALTGTPIENSLTDLWSIMRFAMPRLFGPLPTFQVNYSRARGEEALADLRQRMRPFLLRRLKREVAKELPERIEKDIYCELEGEQRELYEEELASARALLKSAKGQGGSLNVLQALLRLRQVCCDAKLLKGAARQEAEVSAKVQALLDLLEPLVAEGHKVLVFSQFVQMLEIVEGELRKRQLSLLKLTGKTKNRGELVERFQGDGSEQVFLLSLKAAGSGLTLTAASYVVLLDPWWNPAVEAQAIDRAHRIGQTDQVIAYRILAKDTVEEKIRKIQQEKAELAAALFGEDGSLNSKLEMDDLEALLVP